MRIRIALFAVIAAAAGVFFLSRPQYRPPSDLRDAVASQSFDTSIPVFTGSEATLPVPGPSQQKTAVVPAAKVPVKDWTVMFYINGKNNLDASAELSMEELEQVGSSARVNVVVERGSAGKGLGLYDEKWTGARRYYVVKKASDDYTLRHLASKVLMEFPKADMGDYRHAIDFVNWARTKYPAKRYMLVLDNHGSGIMDPEKKPVTEKGISFDDETGNYITNVEIGEILRTTGKVDVLVFNACLMQSAEIAYELKGLADFVIGSEETAWGWTFEFRSFLRGLKAKPATTDGEAAARLVFSSSVAEWKDRKKWSQISILRLSEMSEFIRLLNHWTELAEAVNDVDALKAAKEGVLRFTLYSDEQDPARQQSLYGDLSGFVRLFTENIKSKHHLAWALKAAGSDLFNFIERRLVVANATTGNTPGGRSMADARGLSIYLPSLKGYSMVYTTSPPRETTIVINGVPTTVTTSSSIGSEQLVDAGPEHRASAERLLGGKYSEFAFAKNSRWEAFVKYLWTPRENPVEQPPVQELMRPR